MSPNGFLKYSKKVCIPLYVLLKPEFLNYQYRDNIFNSIKHKYEKKCLNNYGFIYEILSIRRIKSDEIGSIIPTSNLTVMTELICFLPKVNMKFDINIGIILNHGIFCYMDKLRILIPMSYLEDWELQKEFTVQKLIHRIEKRILKKDDIIKIKLIEVRFEKDGYSCIGVLL